MGVDNIRAQGGNGPSGLEDYGTTYLIEYIFDETHDCASFPSPALNPEEQSNLTSSLSISHRHIVERKYEWIPTILTNSARLASYRIRVPTTYHHCCVPAEGTQRRLPTLDWQLIVLRTATILKARYEYDVNLPVVEVYDTPQEKIKNIACPSSVVHDSSQGPWTAQTGFYYG
ncbi:hypothetical protein N7505_007654 [Penicillium chrysogenum]|uniref:Uncharacterized protein n=1 Tax=Penicillium chrysogenum TaxID=5076 RepID=A0ABQ8WE17_PENCH|nr:hypothetical protein N7505_007654 [Penicillium chrysogenum]